MKTITTFSASLSILALLGGAATAGSHAANAKLPQKIKNMHCLIGSWNGKVTLTMGGQRVPMKLSLRCTSASAGHAISCRSTFTDPRGNKHHETDLFGYDPGTNTYHWFAVSDSGETHDHVAAVRKSPTLRWVYRGKKAKKPLVERVAMTFNRNSTAIAFNSQVRIAGKVAMRMNGTVRKRTAASKLSRK